MTTEYSIQKMVSDGTLSTIALGIQYLQRNDIYVRIAGVETPHSGATSGYTWSFLDNNTIRVLPIVPTGVEVVVYRRTDLDEMYNIYSQNAQFDESTIDENNQQLLYIAQEYFEQGVPAQLISGVKYAREDTVNMYYRLKLSDGSYTAEFAVPKGGAAGFEALRRSYADAGLTLVDGSFETGGTLNSTTDVLLQNITDEAYAWTGAFPKVVAPGTDPATLAGFVMRSDAGLRDELVSDTGYMLVPSVQIQRWRDQGDIRGWGAKCDGVTDDTLAWKAVAAHADGTGNAIIVPVGTTIITEKIVFNKPVTLIGAAPSPPTLGYANDGQGEPRGSIIMSRVHGDYTIDVNPPETNPYKRGGHIANVHLLADRSDPLAVDGKGWRLGNLGWNGSFNNLCIEGFHGGGMRLSQVQDSLFNQLEIVDCGTDGGAPALLIDRWTNLCTFVRCRLESCGRLLHIDEGVQSIDFICPHIELGDYPNNVAFSVYGRTNQHPVITMQGCNNIRFQGGMMIGATLNSQKLIYSLTPDTAPYFMYINSDVSELHFSDMWMGFGWGHGKFVQFTGVGSFVNCVFNNISSDVYSLDLRAKSMVFSNNTINYSHNMDNPSGKLCGAAFANATVDNNRFSSWYPGTPTVAYGSFLTGQGVPNNRLGINAYTIVGVNYFVDASFKFVDQHFCEETEFPVGQSTLDLRKFDPAALILLNESGSTINITGVTEGRRVRLMNASTGVVTISTTSPPLQIASGRVVELAYVKATGGLYYVG